MENKIEVLTAPPSLLLLHEYCLLEVFECLEFDDSINLARTCSRLRYVANRMFKKHSTFRLFSRTINKGEVYIVNIFSYIGQHVSSLTLDCGDVLISINNIFGKISKICKNLKCLTIYNWKGDFMLKNIAALYSFENLEVLTLYNCNINNTINFLESFYKLQTLNIDDCIIKPKKLKRFLQNNPGIKSFVYDACDVESDFNIQIFEVIPNIETLCLVGYYDFSNILEPNSLLKLNRLTKLRLNCQCKNVNKFLRELAKKDIMEEMHLEMINTDDHFFDILTLFDKLHLLVIDSRIGSKLKSTIAWPSKLKGLRLEWLELTYNDFVTMINQLKCIESIDVHHCIIANEEKYFNDVERLSQQILCIIDHGNRKQRLNIVLPYGVKQAEDDPPKKYSVDSESLRILNNSYEYDPLKIEIHFSGL